MIFFNISRLLGPLEYAGLLFHFNLSVVSPADPLYGITLASSYEHFLDSIAEHNAPVIQNRLVAPHNDIYRV